jgi:LmbE family N-acetylglucosaminyl deacetylase
MKGSALLLIANFGTEMVATAGALAANVVAGGRTHALILVPSSLRTRQRAQADLERAAQVIGCGIEFAGLSYDNVDLSYQQKARIVKTIREFRPDVVLMQDPEHSWHDLDPARRLGMMLTLEALALAGRDFAKDDQPGLEPWPVPTMYYLWPDKPNCFLDVAPVWHIKERAAECINYQHEGVVPMLEGSHSSADLEKVVPGWAAASLRDKGLGYHKVRERAIAVHHGLGGHGKFALAEAYRRADLFQLHRLEA